MPNYVGVVPWDTLGGNAPSNESMSYLLRDFNKTEIITLASQLNLLSSSFHSGMKQVEILDMLVGSKLIDAQSHKQLVRRLQLTMGSELVITRPGMLELIRAAAIYCSDQISTSRIQDNPHLGRKLARSLLHAFVLCDNREVVPFVSQKKPEASPAECELFNRRMAFAIRSSHFMKSPRTPLLSLGRGLLLLKDELLKANSDHLNRFVASSGLALDEYLDCLAAIQSVGLKRGNTRSFDRMYLFEIEQLSGNDSMLRQRFERYLAIEAQDAAQLSSQYQLAQPDTDFYDKKALRTRPIFRLGDGRFIIMDEMLFADRASAGPFFHSIDQKQARNSFGPFGEACERYTHRLLEDHNHYIRNQGSTELLIKGPLIAKSKAELCDHCVIDGKKIALCETKGVWLKEALLEAKDAEAYWEAVKSNYASVNAGGKRYGMAQLHHAIDGLLKGTIKAEDQQIQIEFGAEIFPVLFAHDTFMAAPFFAHCLALEFMHMFGLDELPKSAKFNPVGNAVTIHTPIVMSLNDVERLHMLRSGSSFCDYLSDFSNKFPDRMEEFNTYIAGKESMTEARDDDFLQVAAKTAINLGLERMYGVKIPKDRI